MNRKKRRSILKTLLGTCSPMTGIERDFHCDYGFNIHTHGLAVINYNCVILDTSPVNVGAGAFYCPRRMPPVPVMPSTRKQRSHGIGTSAPITLEENVWMGANSTVCGGVTIGAGSVIGAEASSLMTFPPALSLRGCPAR
ncbi:MAG: hypothetical protein V8S58_03880 [Lachnospiraceae bacterium]